MPIKNLTVTDKEMDTIFYKEPIKEYTREELREEINANLKFISLFAVGKSHYWQDHAAKRDSLLCIAHAWAQQTLELRYRVRDNFDFAMRVVRCRQ